MRYKKRDDALEYKGHRRAIWTAGWWCDNCGEAILTGAPLLAHEKAFQELKADVDRAVGNVDSTFELSEGEAGLLRAMASLDRGEGLEEGEMDARVASILGR